MPENNGSWNQKWFTGILCVWFCDWCVKGAPGYSLFLQFSTIAEVCFLDVVTLFVFCFVGKLSLWLSCDSELLFWLANLVWKFTCKLYRPWVCYFRMSPYLHLVLVLKSRSRLNLEAQNIGVQRVCLFCIPEWAEPVRI